MDKFKKEQIALAKKVVVKDDYDKIKTIAGVEVLQKDTKLIACIVVCEYPSMKIVETKFGKTKPTIPYMPGFLSYREAPAITEAVNRLEKKPDVLLIKGHGITHPRLGMASHVGLLLDIPTIGIAKRLLCGEVKEGKIIVEGEVKGQAMVTKEKANPLLVSVGHRLCLRTALEIIKKSVILPHKQPEPLFLARKFGKKL